MRNVTFYETFFENRIQELWFPGKPKVGDRGYSEFGPHMHRHIEFQYVLTGSEIFTVDGQEYSSDDNFIFIFPYQIHSNHFNRDSQHISGIVNPNAFESYTKLLTDYRPLSPAVPRSALPEHFDSLIRYTNDLSFDKNHPNQKQLLHDAMTLIIGETLSAMTLVPREEEMGSQSIQTIGYVINYCVSHISEELSLSSVADALYLNKYYVSKLFSSKLGMTFSDFITSQRIYTVCEKLTSGTRPIIEIAYECGFRNLSNFNRVFRARTGMTPREYRNSYSDK